MSASYLHGNQDQSCDNADIGGEVQPGIDPAHFHVYFLDSDVRFGSKAAS
jgi:hypothetical protein